MGDVGLPIGGGGGGPVEEPERFAVPDRPIYTPPGGPPGSGSLSREIYGAMGPDAIRRMIADHYAEMFASEIGFLFPADEAGRAEAIDRSALFFGFLLGGPPAYQRAYGRPMLRARHLRFPIDQRARGVWLKTFDVVLEGAAEKYGFPAEHLEGFRLFLRSFSGWMVNKAEDDGAGPGGG